MVLLQNVLVTSLRTLSKGISDFSVHCVQSARSTSHSLCIIAQTGHFPPNRQKAQGKMAVSCGGGYTSQPRVVVVAVAVALLLLQLSNVPVCSAEDRACAEDQFRCGDGQCIQADHECDGFADCADYSDEYSCREYSQCCLFTHMFSQLVIQ